MINDRLMAAFSCKYMDIQLHCRVHRKLLLKPYSICWKSSIDDGSTKLDRKHVWSKTYLR